MKTNKFWSIMLMLVLTLGTSAVFTSCGGSDDDEFVPTEGNKDEGNKDDGLPEDKTPAGVEAVDLGLPSGVKWASCNIGATKPEEYGDYFAWGETVGYNTVHKSFEWLTYKWSSNAKWTGMTKYTIPDNQKEGVWYSGDTFIGDNKTTLNLSDNPDENDDAARAQWGGKWRMPTKADMEELIKYCDWSWEEFNGVYGIRMTSKMNTSKSIFLPAAGCRGDNSLIVAGSYGYYWSSSLDESYSDDAYELIFDSSSVYSNSSSRYYGLSVRAVCP